MLERLIKFLLPSDSTFFGFLDKIAENLLEGARVFERLREVEGQEAFAELSKHMGEIERVGDELARTMHDALDKTFVTPIDREDLHALTSALETTVDHLDGTASRVSIFGCERLSDTMKEMVGVLGECVKEIAVAVRLLKDLQKADEIQLCVARVSALESKADKLYREGLGKLFASPPPDAASLLRDRELLEALENAADQCNDCVKVIRTVVIKNL